MKQAFSALLIVCILPLFADSDSQPPSEVRAEEVYTPEQRAEETLQLMEQCMRQMIELRRAYGADAEAQQAWKDVEKLWQSLVNHAAADPDMHAAVHAILAKDTELQERMGKLQEELSELNRTVQKDR